MASQHLLWLYRPRRVIQSQLQRIHVEDAILPISQCCFISFEQSFPSWQAVASLLTWARGVNRISIVSDHWQRLPTSRCSYPSPFCRFCRLLETKMRLTSYSLAGGQFAIQEDDCRNPPRSRVFLPVFYYPSVLFRAHAWERFYGGRQMPMQNVSPRHTTDII